MLLPFEFKDMILARYMLLSLASIGLIGFRRRLHVFQFCGNFTFAGLFSYFLRLGETAFKTIVVLVIDYSVFVIGSAAQTRVCLY